MVLILDNGVMTTLLRRVYRAERVYRGGEQRIVVRYRVDPIVSVILPTTEEDDAACTSSGYRKIIPRYTKLRVITYKPQYFREVDSTTQIPWEKPSRST